MKCLKEPLARMVNREEKTRGVFFESRFKSIAVLDDESLLATCAYIDLNPLAAGIATVPEASEHTSIRQRVTHVEDQGRVEDVKPPQQDRLPAWRSQRASRSRTGSARSKIAGASTPRARGC